MLPLVLLSSSRPSSPRLSEAWDKTRFGLLGNFPNIREVPRVFAEGEWYQGEIQKFLKKFMCMGQETMKKIQNKTKAKTTTKTK